MTMSDEQFAPAVVSPEGEVPPVPLLEVSEQDPLYVQLMWSLHSRGGIAHLALITKDLFDQEEIADDSLRTAYIGMICFLIDKGDIVKAGRGNYALASIRDELNLKNVSKYPSLTPKPPTEPAVSQPKKLRMPDQAPQPRRQGDTYRRHR
ncbi:MAG TPA: hypothetical protein VG992_00980 [Candidatus Saccharimonadales bacterium]|nr:hypothetical protein [Candidatus Saccharimonadales bacterium]